LTDQQIEQMTALVRETIGFNKDRGDSVNLMNTPFTLEKTVVTELPLWKQPEIQDLARSFAWPLGTLLFGALVLLGVIRPALKALAQSKPQTELIAHQLDAVESDEPDRPLLAAPEAGTGPVLATASELALEDARKLTRDNPAAVANIVKTWINGEPA
jgi:flagellar M-ring protein FliF